MAHYQVILSYDGSEFAGFQRQAGKDHRTVQDVVETALQRIGWQGDSILAAGRTDAGVHAAGQVIAFDLDWRHTTADLLAALNANLPCDTAAQSAAPVRPDFHPRYDAAARRYRYQIICSAHRDPLRERYAWRIWPAPDFDRLQAAAAMLCGSHDFCAFGSPPKPGGATIRQVYDAGWQAQADELTFEITANAFLYRMARRLVGFQIRIGQGLQRLESLLEILQDARPERVRSLAPARGLTLIKVIYLEAMMLE